MPWSFYCKNRAVSRIVCQNENGHYLLTLILFQTFMLLFIQLKSKFSYNSFPYDLRSVWSVKLSENNIKVVYTGGFVTLGENKWVTKSAKKLWGEKYDNINTVKFVSGYNLYFWHDIQLCRALLTVESQNSPAYRSFEPVTNYLFWINASDRVLNWSSHVIAASFKQ